MKTFDNLLESSLTPQTVCKCMLDAAKGKLRRREVLDTFRHFDKTYETVTACARSPDFVPREDNIHRITDGTNHKVREIEKPMFCPEQILHHVLMEPFQPIVMHGLYEHTCVTIPSWSSIARRRCTVLSTPTGQVKCGVVQSMHSAPLYTTIA